MGSGSRWWYKGKSRLDRAMDDIKMAVMLALIVLLAMALGAMLATGYYIITLFLRGGY